MLSLLLTVLVIALIVYLAFWMIDNIGLPHPFNMIAKVIVAIVGLLALFQKTGLLNGTML